MKKELPAAPVRRRAIDIRPDIVTRSGGCFDFVNTAASRCLVRRNER
jgi:hypothetical protein